MADRVFFFNDTATTEIYTLSLHDALPISPTTTTTTKQNEKPERGRPKTALRADNIPTIRAWARWRRDRAYASNRSIARAPCRQVARSRSPTAPDRRGARARHRNAHLCARGTWKQARR